MTLKSQILSDLPVFFNTDDFAETITYNGVSIKAIVDYGEYYGDETGRRNAARANITVRHSDVSTPAYDDSVIIDGTTWRVFNIEEGDGYTWSLNLISSERPMLGDY